jgi:hypothetical protein
MTSIDVRASLCRARRRQQMRIANDHRADFSALRSAFDSTTYGSRMLLDVTP